jgi:hypothetical protein
VKQEFAQGSGHVGAISNVLHKTMPAGSEVQVSMLFRLNCVAYIGIAGLHNSYGFRAWTMQRPGSVQV